jgi:16S rRNA C967 or C1407 C5-methylase (RsmB/RsmF family)
MRPGCPDKIFGDGMCRRHFDIWRRVKDDPEFWRQVQKDLIEGSKDAALAQR